MRPASRSLGTPALMSQSMKKKLQSVPSPSSWSSLTWWRVWFCSTSTPMAKAGSTGQPARWRSSIVSSQESPLCGHTDRLPSRFLSSPAWPAPSQTSCCLTSSARLAESLSGAANTAADPQSGSLSFFVCRKNWWATQSWCRATGNRSTTTSTTSTCSSSGTCMAGETPALWTPETFPPAQQETFSLHYQRESSFSSKETFMCLSLEFTWYKITNVVFLLINLFLVLKKCLCSKQWCKTASKYIHSLMINHSPHNYTNVLHTQIKRCSVSFLSFTDAIIELFMTNNSVS